MNQAAIAVLLVSNNFLASNFIRTNELPPLLKQAEEKETLILPIIVSPCRFTKTKILGNFQSVNDPKITLKDMNYPEQERVFMKLAEAIEEDIKSTLPYL